MRVPCSVRSRVGRGEKRFRTDRVYTNTHSSPDISDVRVRDQRRRGVSRVSGRTRLGTRDLDGTCTGSGTRWSVTGVLAVGNLGDASPDPGAGVGS